MQTLFLTIKSLKNRKSSFILAVISISVSIFLLIGTNMIIKEAKNSFVNTISQTDLIVGARSGSLNLLLYSIFRIGNPTNNISWDSYKKISNLKQVKWSIPISLGDSHRGFRVIGTNNDYFKHYRYLGDESIKINEGGILDDTYDAVIGYDVAKKLNYTLDSKIILSHGVMSSEFAKHDKHPFKIVGILEKTNTPIDKTVHVLLSGIEAIHKRWEFGVKSDMLALKSSNLTPKSITAFMVGLHNKIDTFRVQRIVNTHKNEPMLAILPGVTLSSLWNTIGSFEKILFAISSLVLISSILTLFTILLTTLNQRRREMAIWRSMGAHFYNIMLSYIFEACFIVITASIVGIATLYGVIFFMKPIISDLYGVYINVSFLSSNQIYLLLTVMILAILASIIPSIIAYKNSLQDGLNIK